MCILPTFIHIKLTLRTCVNAQKQLLKKASQGCILKKTVSRKETPLKILFCVRWAFCTVLGLDILVRSIKSSAQSITSISRWWKMPQMLWILIVYQWTWKWWSKQRALNVIACHKLRLTNVSFSQCHFSASPNFIKRLGSSDHLSEFLLLPSLKQRTKLQLKDFLPNSPLGLQFQTCSSTFVIVGPQTHLWWLRIDHIQNLTPQKWFWEQSFTSQGKKCPCFWKPGIFSKHSTLEGTKGSRVTSLLLAWTIWTSLLWGHLRHKRIGRESKLRYCTKYIVWLAE